MAEQERVADEAGEQRAWHALEAEQTLAEVDSSKEGLSEEEAERRLKAYGPNRLKPPKRRSAWRRLLAQFHNVLIYVLIVAAVVTAGLGQWLDASVIAAVVLINAVIGYIQEGKAERAIDAIRDLLSPQARVRRGGKRKTVKAETLVPGDLVSLQAGDKVPADLRLLRIRDLRIEEAALTGESVPTEKGTDAVDADAGVGDRSSMAFSGTIVAYGTGTGVVVGTAEQTEIGRISGMLAEIQPLTTPLLRDVSQFGRWLALGILVISVLIFAVGVLLKGFSTTEMFQAGVALAVAAIPEGLPAIMTITLALGVQRMARRNAIIRRLPAVETLGSVTVICSDKTGTLTRNEMTVQTVAVADERMQVSGVGYAPEGSFTVDGREFDPNDHPLLLELTRAGLLCNDASIRHEDEAWVLHGDPTEGSLVTLAMKAGHEEERTRQAYRAVDTIPFESEHKYMATLHEIDGEAVIYVKGAPERVLEMCERMRTGEGEEAELDVEGWHDKADAMAREGQRLLALAVRRPAPEAESLERGHVESGMTLLGMVGIIDPPREEAIEAVRHCREAGIRVKMLTGDHGKTAGAIGRQMGIGGEDQQVVAGPQVQEMAAEELRRRVRESDVFARVSPEHKLHIVEALQDDGGIVSVTGDGVNDAPALKRADIGVSMGIKGTEAAKEASDMVLADDNFASIEQAVKEGRTVYDNIRKTLLFILPTNGGEAGLIIAAVLLGVALPVTPLQVLWVNMVTAVTLALALAFELPERGVMRRPPRDPAEPILTPFLIWRIGFVSVLIIAGAFGLFAWVRADGGSIELARTAAVNTVVMCEVFYVLNSRHLYLPVLNREGLLGNRYMLLAIVAVLAFQAAFTYALPLQVLFATEAMPAGLWGWAAGAGLLVLLIVEAEKAFWRRRDPSIVRASRAQDEEGEE